MWLKYFGFYKYKPYQLLFRFYLSFELSTCFFCINELMPFSCVQSLLESLNVLFNVLETLKVLSHINECMRFMYDSHG